MASEEEIIEAISRHLEGIKKLSGIDQEEFLKRYQSVQSLAKNSTNNFTVVREEIFRLYADFPAVENFLQAEEPHLWETAAELAPVKPILKEVFDNTVIPQPVQRAAAPQTNEAAPMGNGGEPPPVEPAPSRMESKIQVFKEVVTATLALLVVGFTLGMASYAIKMAGDNKFTQSKDILMLLLGPFGTALGYYFGRLPADARAAQAQELTAQAQQKAGRAEAHAAQVTDQAIKVADTAEALSGATARTRSAGGFEDSRTGEAALRLKAETRELLRLARRR